MYIMCGNGSVAMKSSFSDCIAEILGVAPHQISTPPRDEANLSQPVAVANRNQRQIIVKRH
jgi:hypothetical protein